MSTKKKFLSKVLIFLVSSSIFLILSSDRIKSSVPVISGDSKEIRTDVFSITGSTRAVSEKEIFDSLGQPGGVTKLTDSGKKVLEGYWAHDILAPTKITDFQAVLGDDTGEILFTWSAPDDDGNPTNTNILGTLKYPSTYYIQFATYTTVFWRYTDAQIKISTYNVTPATSQNYTYILSSPMETDYYFHIWTQDGEGNISKLSNRTTCFVLLRPGPITNLVALTTDYYSYGLYHYAKTIALQWTAPGDDGYFGNLDEGSKYAIQSSTWWQGIVWSTYSVDTIIISTSGVKPADWQYFTLTGLAEATTYYIRAWTCDELGNWSEVSNLTTGWAPNVILAVDFLPTLISATSTWVDLGITGTDSTVYSSTGMIARNTGNVKESYALNIPTGTALSDYTVWWTAVSTGPPEPFNDRNKFILWAIFKATQPLSASMFENDDVLISTTVVETQKATSYRFSDGTSGYGNSGVNIEPYNIKPLLGDTTLWFKFLTPVATSTTQQQTIPVIITATEATD